MTYERGQVVRVPFPFTDQQASKNRPALVLSTARFNVGTAHLLLAMITSAKNPPWTFDCPLDDLHTAGLPAPSVVRMKLFTLDARLVRGALGALALGDAARVQACLAQILDLSP
ncbi:MAG: type II toxin-antitoxin system PemK/MazF family toxin [Candidatus Igneacidithiobacillus chanchocoensis]